jgi:hypothetical protein
MDIKAGGSSSWSDLYLSQYSIYSYLLEDGSFLELIEECRSFGYLSALDASEGEKKILLGPEVIV